MGRLLSTALAGTLCILASHGAVAATWHGLTSPALLDAWPGPDLLWGTGDPAIPGYPAEGPFGPLPGSGETPSNEFPPGGVGAASASISSSGFFGTAIGTLVTNGSAPDHPGVNTITSWSGDSLNHLDVPGFTDIPAPFVLDGAGINTVEIAPDGRTATLMTTLEFTTLGITTEFIGTGYFLYPGEVPGDVFPLDPALAGHFAFIEPLAPPGWEVLATFVSSWENFDTVTGLPTEDFGTGTSVSYTFDTPVPLPPAAVLMLPALALLGYRRKR